MTIPLDGGENVMTYYIIIENPTAYAHPADSKSCAWQYHTQNHNFNEWFMFHFPYFFIDNLGIRIPTDK